jgi:hypothetical protein
VVAFPLESLDTLPILKQTGELDPKGTSGQNCTVKAVLAVTPVSWTVTLPVVSTETCPFGGLSELSE